MKEELIAREKKCLRDCLQMANTSTELGHWKVARTVLEDAIRSINEIERLSKNETVVLVGTVLTGRNSNGRH